MHDLDRIRPTPQLDVHHRMELRVSAAQLLLSELLLLPAVGLEQRVEVELAGNAALELPAVPSCPGCGQLVWTGTCLRCDRRPPRQPPPGDPADRDRDRDRDRLAGLAAPPAPREQVLLDAAPALHPGERAVAAHLLADVDDAGLLVEPEAAVAERLGVTERTVRRVIEALRASGTPGLCARTLAERLRLQVSAAAGAHPPPAAVTALLALGLGPLAGGDTKDGGGLSPDELRSALAWIRSHVDADLVGPEPAPPPAPVDVVVRCDGGTLAVDLVGGCWSAVRVAESYAAAAADPLVRPDVLRARRFLDGLDRRDRTMRRVARFVVDHQARRVVAGPRAHRPLLRRQVAAELRLHESTVSRAVAGKQVLLPSGETVPFGALFGAARGVQECLLDLVGAETVPRCDAELAEALAERGHRVSRRTVAKYRATLRIPDQRRR
jgi:RNA polymerase sigma-54 factor